MRFFNAPELPSLFLTAPRDTFAVKSALFISPHYLLYNADSTSAGRKRGFYADAIDRAHILDARKCASYEAYEMQPVALQAHFLWLASKNIATRTFTTFYSAS